MTDAAARADPRQHLRDFRLDATLGEGSLADRLRHGPPLTAHEAYVAADDVLAGLAAIHEVGHLHRDVKPANVLLKHGRACTARK